MPKSNTPKVPSSNSLGLISIAKPNTPIQLQIEIEKEVDGIGMGVLSDGTPYLTGRGLARLCGINAGRISEMASSWNSDSTKMTMGASVRGILARRGYFYDKPYIEIPNAGAITYAYPDTVCIAVLEHYAFEIQPPVEIAVNNFRLLAGKALADFIFATVGYNPTVPIEWRQFHDRVSLVYDAVPRGFFGIFKEMANVIVTLGQAGLMIDKSFVPDISVGSCWSRHWVDNDFNSAYGERQKYDHAYPDYFPQSASNPQEAWCYPDSALGEFRRWLHEDYIGAGKFRNYINQKVRGKELPETFARVAIAALGDDSN